MFSLLVQSLLFPEFSSPSGITPKILSLTQIRHLLEVNYLIPNDKRKPYTHRQAFFSTAEIQQPEVRGKIAAIARCLYLVFGV
jgi:hypothetical protein